MATVLITIFVFLMFSSDVVVSSTLVTRTTEDERVSSTLVTRSSEDIRHEDVAYVLPEKPSPEVDASPYLTSIPRLSRLLHFLETNISMSQKDERLNLSLETHEMDSGEAHDSSHPSQINVLSKESQPPQVSAHGNIRKLVLTTSKSPVSKDTNSQKQSVHVTSSNVLTQTALHHVLTKSGHRPHARRNTSEVAVRRLPKAIIIGVKKAGTRALLEFLRIHPNVECSGPEPHYFDKNYNMGLEWYRDRMPETYSDQIAIEKTPGYFVTKEAPQRIYDMDPHIKLLLVVRDPVTRSISDYCQAATKHTLQPYESMALLDESLGLVNTSWSAIKIGVYSRHMEHWLQVFPLAQIHVVDGERLIDDPASELAKVEQFLGLPKFITPSHFYLRGFKGKFPCLIKRGKPHCLGEKTKGREHPVVKEAVLQRLQDFYRPFNAKFYQQVGQNFDWN
ncbi:heparan sulfate glucosamine 3-O-sulfotransferase 6-like [Biomphalaria glabrata]|uniref:Heparan sulfate glucosamine 3-O-sulfotransferase 6-like n=1 Tax=Biomphalaria glabrata TaxID=6526 RepID=A0A9U8E3W5_BIOGL|nr:heparan sulfate glucosamine 3-O-sulfotransferase 6-like [Biomphalaria glabrata]